MTWRPSVAPCRLSQIVAGHVVVVQAKAAPIHVIHNQIKTSIHLPLLHTINGHLCPHTSRHSPYTTLGFNHIYSLYTIMHSFKNISHEYFSFFFFKWYVTSDNGQFFDKLNSARQENWLSYIRNNVQS